jgi:hypothetical protein
MMLAWRSPKHTIFACVFLALAVTAPHLACAWGDEGHKIIVLIAEHYLDPAARAKVAMLLAADSDTLTGHDIASEATWADKYRDTDRDTTKVRYNATRLWHFVDIELARPNLASACFGHPPLPPGIPASKGPPRACVADKIDQFAAELGNPGTSASERLLALKFLLHVVGDLHQPLHAADDHDAGGNKKLVTAGGLHPGNLHRYWDVEFVERLGTDPHRVAASLIGQISESQRQEWLGGKPADWAMEAFALGSRQCLMDCCRAQRPKHVFASPGLRGASCAGCRASAESGRGQTVACSEPSPLCYTMITDQWMARARTSAPA